MTKYVPTIGIECHVQLKTKTKLFSEVDNDAVGKEPNSCVSPVDYALPGMLPRLNESAIKLAIRAGKAMNAKINKASRFDRKHYFYPDSPKGYQITQYYAPIIGEGYIEIGEGKKVRIEHAHLEGDAGKLTHFASYSLVDLNRVDTPLLEIVSQPDMHSSSDARNYCRELWRTMIFADVSNGDLYNGNMRFDVNVSIAEEGSDKLGVRAEIKNLNSFRSVERAVEYEIERQTKLLESGEKVIQETRGFDDATGKTTSQRSKEEAKDYRYMPEPDIPPLNLSDEYIETEKTMVGLLPMDYRNIFTEVLPADILDILLDYPELMKKLVIKKQDDETFEPISGAKLIANLFASVLLAEEKYTEMLHNLPSQKNLADLASMNTKKELSSTATKEVFLRFFDPQMKGKDAKTIAKELNLLQENNLSALEKIVDEVLNDESTKKAQEDYKNGEQKVLGFLVGQVMKASKGKANPSSVQDILRRKLQ